MEEECGSQSHPPFCAVGCGLGCGPWSVCCLVQCSAGCGTVCGCHAVLAEAVRWVLRVGVVQPWEERGGGCGVKRQR
jgi:hypothetical protein